MKIKTLLITLALVALSTAYPKRAVDFVNLFNNLRSFVASTAQIANMNELVLDAKLQKRLDEVFYDGCPKERSFVLDGHLRVFAGSNQIEYLVLLREQPGISGIGMRYDLCGDVERSTIIFDQARFAIPINGAPGTKCPPNFQPKDDLCSEVKIH